MERNTSWIVRVGSYAALLIMSLHQTQASAAFLQDFSGHFRGIEEDDPSFELSVSFAVLDRTNNSATDAWGTGLDFFDFADFGNGDQRKLDVRADYLYLYQVVNDGSNGPAETATDFAVALQSREFVTSFGRWNLTLTDASGAVRPDNPFGANGAGFQKAAPAQLGVISPGLQAASLSNAGTQLTSNSFNAIFNLTNSDPTSQVFGFTSNRPPVMFQASLDACADDIACGSFPVPQPLPDFDNDGLVNLADYNLWRDQLGQVVPSLSGADADGDGVVGIGDYQVWSEHYHQIVPLTSASASAGHASVPEATSVVTLSLLLTGLLLHRRLDRVYAAA